MSVLIIVCIQTVCMFRMCLVGVGINMFCGWSSYTFYNVDTCWFVSVGACTSGGCYIILPLHETLHSCTSLVACHGRVKCDSVFMTVLDLT